MVAGGELTVEKIGSEPVMDPELDRGSSENPDRTWIKNLEEKKKTDLVKEEKMAVMRWLFAAAISRNIEKIRERGERESGGEAYDNGSWRRIRLDRSVD